MVYCQRHSSLVNTTKDKGREETETYGTLAADARAPWRGRVHDAKVVSDAIGTAGRLRDEVRRRRVGALDLHETLGAYRLVAAARAVDVRGVVLDVGIGVRAG